MAFSWKKQSKSWFHCCKIWIFLRHSSLLKMRQWRCSSLCGGGCFWNNLNKKLYKLELSLTHGLSFGQVLLIIQVNALGNDWSKTLPQVINNCFKAVPFNFLPKLKRFVLPTVIIQVLDFRAQISLRTQGDYLEHIGTLAWQASLCCRQKSTQLLSNFQAPALGCQSSLFRHLFSFLSNWICCYPTLYKQ